MKFVSPAQRGTTWRWTWSVTPAPATLPRFQPRLNPCGAYTCASAPMPCPASRWISSASSAASAARQKMQPSCSSACPMYSSRHGAQSCCTLEEALQSEEREQPGQHACHRDDDDPERRRGSFARKG